MRTGAGRPDRGGRERGTGIPARPTPRLLAHAAGAFTQDGEARRTVGGPAESSRSCQPRPSLCCEVHADSYRGDFEENLLARRWRNPKAGNPIFFQRRLRKQALDPDGRGSHRIPARQETPGVSSVGTSCPVPCNFKKKTEDVFQSVRICPVGRPRAEREFEFSGSPLEEDRPHQRLSDQEDVYMKPEGSRTRLRPLEPRILMFNSHP